jgi:hypothetical protein
MDISTLSSRLTFVTKIIFPTFWISAFGAGTFAMWAGKFTDRQSAPRTSGRRYLYVADDALTGS